MKDLPAFTTESGVATIVLQEVPYSKTAYIIVRDTPALKEFIAECVGFCRAAGAEKVYATGHEELKSYPYHTAIWKLEAELSQIPQAGSCQAITQENIGLWRQIYNEKMQGVLKAAYLTTFSLKKLLNEGNAYFVHRDGELLGIGVATGDRIDAVASVVPGMGAQVVRALCHALSEDAVTVEVASTNQRAIKLYEKLGFVPVAELSRWYKIL